MSEIPLIGLPGGELIEDTLKIFCDAQMPLDNGGDPRTYGYQFADCLNKPLIDFLAIRTKDAVRFLNDPDSTFSAVLVGKDIAVSKNCEWEYEFPPFFPQAGLYVAATPNWEEVKKDKPNWQDLNRKIIFTPYPTIAKNWATEKGIKKAKVRYAAGKIEGLWKGFPKNYAVIDVKSDKDKPPRTGLANKLVELETLNDITLNLVMVTKPVLLPDETLAISFLINQFKDTYANT